MRISVFGLGYVGTVVSGCLARLGHDVIGVDVDRHKVELVNSGRSPIVEQEIGPIIQREVAGGRLSATTQSRAAVAGADIVKVCVGTPGLASGRPDLSHMRRVCADIGAGLQAGDGATSVVVRSTLLPGTMRELVIPALEAASACTAGVDFGVCYNPEFLREGSAVQDFLHPSRTVIGELNPASGMRPASLYEALPGPKLHTDLETAEMIKFADNAWHALKVGFANEIGNFCKAVGVDGHRLMEAFCLDTRLNISTSYLKPGFAFGGTCLPKDLRALLVRARAHDLSLPILEAVLPSNELQLARGVEAVVAAGHRKVGLLGLSFKAGTDDLRGSPIVELAERLVGKGYELRIYDRNVNLARIGGTNRTFILERIPHIATLMVDSVDEVLAHADTLVIGNAADEFADVLRHTRDGQVVVDLVRISPERSVAGVYEGICW
jgi:GDP-mannose 6-dehydrogenase